MDPISIRSKAATLYWEGETFLSQGQYASAIARFFECQELLLPLLEPQSPIPPLPFDYLGLGYCSFLIWKAHIGQINATDPNNISYDKQVSALPHARNTIHLFLRYLTYPINIDQTLIEPLSMARSLNELGNFFMYFKEFHNSLRSFQLAISILIKYVCHIETDEDRDLPTLVLYNLAENYHQLMMLYQNDKNPWNEWIIEKSETLIEFYQQMVSQIDSPLKRYSFIFSFHYCFGCAFAFQNHLKKSFISYRKAFSIYPKIIKEVDPISIPAVVFLDKINSLNLYQRSVGVSLSDRELMFYLLETLTDTYLQLQNNAQSHDISDQEINWQALFAPAQERLKERRLLAKRFFENRRHTSFFLGKLGDAYLRLQSYGQAYGVHLQEIDMSRQQAESTGHAEEYHALAKRLNRLGLVYLNWRHDIAIEFFQLAIHYQELYLKTLKRPEKKLENQCFLATYYLNMSQSTESSLKIECLGKAINLYSEIFYASETSHNTRILAAHLNDLGNLHATDYSVPAKKRAAAALKAFTRAIGLLENLIKNLEITIIGDQRLLATYLNNKGEAYAKIFNRTGAREQFEKAIALIQQILEETNALEDRRALQKYLNNLAETDLHNLRGETLAIENCRDVLDLLNLAKTECLQLIEQENKPEDRRSLVKILINISIAMQVTANGTEPLREALQVLRPILEKSEKDMDLLQFIYSRLHKICSDPLEKELFDFAKKVFFTGQTFTDEEEAYVADFNKLYKKITRNNSPSCLRDLLQFMRIVAAERNNAHLPITPLKAYLEAPADLTVFLQKIDALEKRRKAQISSANSRQSQKENIATAPQTKREAEKIIFFSRKKARKEPSSTTSEAPHTHQSVSMNLS